MKCLHLQLMFCFEYKTDDPLMVITLDDLRMTILLPLIDY